MVQYQVCLLYTSIVTKRNKANILSLLTIVESEQSNILSGVSGVLNISDDSKMLVPYIDLYKDVYKRQEQIVYLEGSS